MRHNTPWRFAAIATLTCASGIVLNATSYQTDLFLQPPAANSAGIDHVRYFFSTDALSGPINQNSLTDWSMTLFSGNSLIYTDTILSGGVYQSLGGVARLSSDVFWDFDLTTLTLNQMANFSLAKLASTTGTQFLVNDGVTLPADSQVTIRLSDGGALLERSGNLLASQSTTIVPEPMTTGLLGLGLLGVAAGRRRLRSVGTVGTAACCPKDPLACRSR